MCISSLNLGLRMTIHLWPHQTGGHSRYSQGKGQVISDTPIAHMGMGICVGPPRIQRFR